MLVSAIDRPALAACPPLRRVERAAAPSTRPFDEFLRSTEVVNPATLPPAPFWQALERENAQRRTPPAAPGRLIDVLA
ncbi:MAG TPA: hypothetical protein VHN77_05090 [Phycisphaerales bacterium]|nr:hypothetical protein [Phycisphaerales bacterium]